MAMRSFFCANAGREKLPNATPDAKPADSAFVICLRSKFIFRSSLLSLICVLSTIEASMALARCVGSIAQAVRGGCYRAPDLRNKAKPEPSSLDVTNGRSASETIAP
jgi:hypothetical protein